MAEDDDPDGEYDPTDPTAPARAPPLRQTAPQSPYTGKQIAMGLVVLVIGLAVVFGIPLALV